MSLKWCLKKKTPNQTKAKHYCTRSRERKFPFHTESLPNAILQGAKMAQTCLSLHFFFVPNGRFVALKATFFLNGESVKEVYMRLLHTEAIKRLSWMCSTGSRWLSQPGLGKAAAGRNAPSFHILLLWEVTLTSTSWSENGVGVGSHEVIFNT